MDGTIAVYDAVHMKFLHHLEGHHMPVRSMVFSPIDPHVLFTASDDCHIYIYDAKEKSLIGAMSGHASWVLSIDTPPPRNWDPTAKRLRASHRSPAKGEGQVQATARAGDDDILCRLRHYASANASSEPPAARGGDPDPAVGRSEFDLRCLVSLAKAYLHFRWEVDSDVVTVAHCGCREITRFTKSRPILRASPNAIVEQSKRLAKVAMEHYNKTKKIKFELVDVMPVIMMSEPEGLYTHIKFTARSNKEGSLDQLFFAELQRCGKTRQAPSGQLVTCCEPLGFDSIAGGGSGSVKLWDTEKWQPITSLAVPRPEGARPDKTGSGKFVLSVTWSSDGKLLACGSMDGSIAVYDAVRMKFLHHLEGHHMPVRSMVFSLVDLHVLFIASDDCHIHIYDAKEKSHWSYVRPCKLGAEH
ncbi:hypothetical protein PR202_gb13006 [Eleusine coracana subsp. coracana]|uniref:DUF3615 domain-containing protein n=1 Tax=Eleusine coracana subsp. coracana TaxID=191504 RepID=A0AAV5ES27_ELECO|nr:hypothetical protein PR202_gb13006 [Eleusine coracana subsp. coracana]